MRFALAFTALGAALAWQAAGLALGAGAGGVARLLAVPEAYLAAGLLALGAAYALRQAGVPVERRLARPWQRALLWPYRVLGLAVLRVTRRAGREAAADRVAPGLWVGRRPFADEVGGLRAAGVSAVLNLCAEFRPPPWPDGPMTPVLTLPLLDGAAPTPSELGRAADWVAARRAEGHGVLIHCAQGHGRSGTVAAAALVVLGLAPDADAALAGVRAARPGARPSRAQRRALSRFLSARAGGG